MTPADIALLAVAGFAAGILNAIAGGGTIFTFSALLAVGIPPVAANATSATAVVLGSAASAAADWRYLRAHWRRLMPLCLVSIVGGAAGAGLLLMSDDAGFRRLVPWLLLLATALFAAGPQLREAFADKSGAMSSGRRSWIGTAVQGVVAIYGGYFGAGMGVMMLASLSLTQGPDYQAANATKNLLAIVLQSMAVIIFLASGVVRLDLALLISTTSIASGWFGVLVARRVPAHYVRWFVVVSGFALSLWYFFK